jgi:hypothetical protein
MLNICLRRDAADVRPADVSIGTNRRNSDGRQID